MATNDEMVDIENRFSSIRVNDNFETFAYNLNNDQNIIVSSIVESLGLKHALQMESQNRVILVNGEKGFYIDENERGLCYIGLKILLNKFITSLILLLH